MSLLSDLGLSTFRCLEHNLVCFYTTKYSHILRNVVKYLANSNHENSTAWVVSVFGVFLARVFPHSDWIFSSNAGKYGPEVYCSTNIVFINSLDSAELCSNEIVDYNCGQCNWIRRWCLSFKSPINYQYPSLKNAKASDIMLINAYISQFLIDI